MSNPMRWPTYALGGTDNVWQSQYTGWNLFDPMGPLPFGGNQAVDHPFINDGSGNYRSLYGVLPYWQSLSASGELHTSNIQHDFLLDDGNETILDRRYRNQEDDAVFPVSEMDALALSETDFSGLGISSTVRDLAIVNLDKGDPNETSQIRKRLTTDSWDRLDFGQGHSVNLTENRAWEFTTWNGGGTFSEFFAGAGTFPPEFSSAVAGSANDPLRPEVRTLLKSEQGYNFFLNPNGNDPRHPRQRLNINRILSDDNAAADVSEPFDMNTAFDSDGNPHFRNLTPHPDLVALNLANTSAWGAGTMTIPNLIHQNTASIPAAAAFSYLGNNIATGSDTDRMNLAIAQEWWARYDRQRLARDIYTLLWILGGGDDATNTTVTAAYYTPEQIQEMAQFAVNYVDALDRDDVITRFEYDNDLTDGWDAAGGSDLQFVTGVEAQQLTISEVLWVQTADTGGDEAPSIWDDNEVREFMYIELRNTSPFEVELRDETFRIARYNPSSTSPDASFVFKTDPANPVIIKPGQTFLIGCHDNSMIVNVSGTDELRASDFYVNPDMGSDFDQIVPYRIDGTDPLDEALPTATSEHPITTLDLDLSYTNSTGSTDHQNRFEFDTAAPFTAPMLNGNTLVSTDAAWSGITTCEIRLQRRKQLRTDGIVDPSADEWGEWVEVDSFENVTQRSFNASGTITDEIDNLISQERAEPFDRENVTDNSTGVGTPSRYHTLGASDFTVDSMDNDDASDDRNQGNSNSPSPFDVWQPHFDRDFSSEFELLSIPLFGPEDVTKKLANGTSQMLSGWYTHPITDGTPGVPSVAMVRFLNPRLDLDNNGTIDYDISNDSLVDTKTRTAGIACSSSYPCRPAAIRQSVNDWSWWPVLRARLTSTRFEMSLSSPRFWTTRTSLDSAEPI
ncbi:MAG: hypothetical protein R3C02_17870 [Planctomycetaceae bacterium]